MVANVLHCALVSLELHSVPPLDSVSHFDSLLVHNGLPNVKEQHTGLEWLRTGVIGVWFSLNEKGCLIVTVNCEL